ncbi:MAG TPA: hypothetical protein PLD47_01530 [Aggregatilineales bacterium]|nr:hypothetical protein [Anaerolineales bacterium]HRE46379.1 hypothetical protein [Aggregatilineales bacterium]
MSNRGKHMIGGKRRRIAMLVALMVATGLACSGLNDVVGQRPARPTPTPEPFATATPGGRVSVMIGTNAAPGRQTPIPFGEIVAPAATATVLAATVIAATAAANATPNLPFYVPDACPNPASPLPPDKPVSFTQYPEAIGQYLSVGGSPALLEGVLRSWGSIREGALVQADTDLTGDGIAEIVIALYDPLAFVEGQASPGVLLVYGCAQGGYRLLFNTVYSPTVILPELKRVGDMNGDARAELVFTQATCTALGCDLIANIYSWSATLGVFKTLNTIPINATGGKVGIGDPDGDGVLELTVTYNPALTASSGPTRQAVDYWDWDGSVYRMAMTALPPAAYLIHAVHDADTLFTLQAWEEALEKYDAVRLGRNLQAWNLPNEAIMLKAYATYRKMLIQAFNEQRRTATLTLERIKTENPPGTPGEGYVVIGQAFIDTLNKTRNVGKACAAAVAALPARPETLIYLNSYGYANRTYSLAEMCPFKE